MLLQSALTREHAGKRFLEFATIGDSWVTRTQIEVRHGLIYMRAKRRSVEI